MEACRLNIALREVLVSIYIGLTDGHRVRLNLFVGV